MILLKSSVLIINDPQSPLVLHNYLFVLASFISFFYVSWFPLSAICFFINYLLGRRPDESLSFTEMVTLKIDHRV